MNTNELKINGNTLEDFLQTSREVDEYDNLDCRICAADSIRQLVEFVRQQQAEIEALKEKLIMEEESYILLDEECLFAKEAIKLHQAEIEALKAKTLTDEEILKEARESADYWMNHFDGHSKADMEILYRHVADKFRAILRKAGEK